MFMHPPTNEHSDQCSLKDPECNQIVVGEIMMTCFYIGLTTFVLFPVKLGIGGRLT